MVPAAVKNGMRGVGRKIGSFFAPVPFLSLLLGGCGDAPPLEVGFIVADSMICVVIDVGEEPAGLDVEYMDGKIYLCYPTIAPD